MALRLSAVFNTSGKDLVFGSEKVGSVRTLEIDLRYNNFYDASTVGAPYLI